MLAAASDLLTSRAVAMRSMTYGEFATALGLPPNGLNRNNHPIRAVLAALDAEDKKLRRPHRSCLVVRKQDGIPGPGFFTMLGRTELSGAAIEDRRKFWREHCALLSQFYRNS